MDKVYLHRSTVVGLDKTNYRSSLEALHALAPSHEYFQHNGVSFVGISYPLRGRLVEMRYRISERLRLVLRGEV
jgi:hypothetical protein